MTIPDALIHKNLQPEDTLIAYHKGDQYCERVSPAKIDIHNAEHIHQRPYKNCYRYHNNTAVCQKNARTPLQIWSRLHKNRVTKIWNSPRNYQKTNH